MQLKTPNLSGLRAFEAAARSESFADAAKELGLTPAAISRAVRRLEDELGFELFHRAHRAVSLTDAGARYAQKVTDGFRQLSTSGMEGPKNRPNLTLDVEATFARQWLLPRLRQSSFKVLDITLTVRVHHDPPRVIPATADLAIVWGFADYSGFKRSRLVSPKTILVAAPDLGIAKLDNFAAMGLIHEANDHWWRLVYQEAGLAFPEDAPSLTLTRCDLPIEAAVLGLGAAVADDVIAEKELRSGILQPIDGPRLDSQDYFLLSRKTASVPARAFTAWLMNEAKSFACWQASFQAV
jgi:LysR family glycine cleavage system transcriptional activator